MIRNTILFRLLILYPTLLPAQTWWGYTGDAPVMAYKTSPPETCDFAIMLPANRYGLSGHTIRGIRFYVPESEAVKDFSVWMSTSRPSNVSSANIAYKALDYATLTPGQLNEVLFDEPYTITTRNVYLGYSFTATDNTVRNVGAVDLVGNTDACWLRLSEYTGGQWSTTFYSTFSLAISALFGEDFEPGVRVTKAGFTTALRDSLHTVDMTLENCSPEGIRSIDYVVTDDEGAESDPLHLDFTEVNTAMSTTDISLPLPPTSVLGFHKPSVRITQVNGKDNAIEAAKATATIDQLVISQAAAVKRVVEEEYTGLWCGWCPAGTVGMELAEKQFGDKYIGISVHHNDALAGSNNGGYNSIISSQVPNFPACFINRNGLKPNPYYGLTEDKPFGLADVIADELSRPAEADVDVQASWVDDTKKRLRATATVRFHLDNTTAPYSVAFVLLANGLKNNAWVQANYYSGYNYVSSDPNLKPYVDAGERLTGLTFNNVAIASAGVTSGVSGSIAAPIVEDEPQTYTSTIALPSSTLLVGDKENLRVVCLLLNRTRGNIVNAATCSIAEPTGILTATTPSRTLVARYDAQGRRITAPVPGLNILRFADGHTEKVMVK